LNHLLRKGSPQRLQVGDASTVFWAVGVSRFADDFAAMFGAVEKGDDDPDRDTRAISRLLEATKSGVYLEHDKDTRFCVLGLAPNAARIAVRFWQIGPIKDFALNVAQHFKDIEIVKPTSESGYLPLWRLLGSIALQHKSENIPPEIAGDTMRAIFARLPYPATLLQAAVRRCRAERDIGHPRAAIIKASINRLIRHDQFYARELEMSLDKSNSDPGYRLGRLFAALERIQATAQPGINATIRDRYYGAASSSPASVFPVLLRLKNHHLSKIDKPALAVWLEKLLAEIVEGIADFPSQLSLREQGLFAIGYYHQQQDFFKGSKQESGSTSSDSKGEQ
jgi:CRISPR-associated protein Csd1